MKVKFLPQDIEIEIERNQTVLDLARENNIEIKSICNGMPSCAECRVKVVEGEHNLLPPSNKELSLIGTGYFLDQRRLACQLLCFGDVTLDLSEQVKKASEWQKRPQGSVVKSMEEESYAVSGNLIDENPILREQVASSDDTTDLENGLSDANSDFYKDLDRMATSDHGANKSPGKEGNKRHRRSRSKGRRGRNQRSGRRKGNKSNSQNQ